jgi:hypothetical protein
MKIVNPTLAFQVGNAASLPIIKPNIEKTTELASRVVTISKQDWDSSETSWGF